MIIDYTVQLPGVVGDHPVGSYEIDADPVRLCDIRSSWPYEGQFFFRAMFVSGAGTANESSIFLDLVNESTPLPSYDGKVTLRALPLYMLESKEEDLPPSFGMSISDYDNWKNNKLDEIGSSSFELSKYPFEPTSSSFSLPSLDWIQSSSNSTPTIADVRSNVEETAAEVAAVAKEVAGAAMGFMKMGFSKLAKVSEKVISLDKSTVSPAPSSSSSTPSKTASTSNVVDPFA